MITSVLVVIISYPCIRMMRCVIPLLALALLLVQTPGWRGMLGPKPFLWMLGTLAPHIPHTPWLLVLPPC